MTQEPSNRLRPDSSLPGLLSAPEGLFVGVDSRIERSQHRRLSISGQQLNQHRNLRGRGTTGETPHRKAVAAFEVEVRGLRTAPEAGKQSPRARRTVSRISPRGPGSRPPAPASRTRSASRSAANSFARPFRTRPLSSGPKISPDAPARSRSQRRPWRLLKSGQSLFSARNSSTSPTHRKGFVDFSRAAVDDGRQP